MITWAALGMGFLSKAQCADVAPCRAALAWKGRPFKLSFCIHSASVEALDGGRISQGQRPFIQITVGDRVKKTEMGDWSREEGRWRFHETITLEVSPEDEVSIAIVCNQQYDLVVAALSLAAKIVGEVCVPVASVLPQLKMEDRDIDGMVYATPSIGFDLIKDGAKVGKATVAFETKQPPPPSRTVMGGGGPDPWCNMRD
mmetsp:Transcript_103275/g.267029  ORF Transcript_103275/g.267029 Transcript_103275/m.267029 type:complete len:200 (+) Transcript_103275:86-685(+)